MPSVQLVRQMEDGPLAPLLSTTDGILFGQLNEAPNVYVLSDPDLINNAGLAEPGIRPSIRAALTAAYLL